MVCHAPPHLIVIEPTARGPWCASFARNGESGGGGERIRTDDRLVANQVLYQLSYAPDDQILESILVETLFGAEWWA